MTTNLPKAAAMTEALVDGYQGSLIAAVQAARVAAKDDTLQSTKKTRVAMTINAWLSFHFSWSTSIDIFLFI
jgi:hypothetical protein